MSGVFGPGRVRVGSGCLILSALLAAAPAGAGQFQLVSQADPPLPVVHGRSYEPATSADARYVAFVSDSPRVADGTTDFNDQDDVFLYDRATGTMTLVSRGAAAPTQTGNSWSRGPSLSADGRYIAFVSLATDLVPGQVDGANSSDVFLFDRVTATTVLVSRATGTAATAANAWSGMLSADGGFVAFTSPATNLVPGQVDTAGTTDVFLYEIASGTVTLVSHAAGAPTTAGNGNCSLGLSLSADGRYVAYSCAATNLVAGQTDGSDTYDVFLYDRTLGTSVLVSRTSASPTAAGGGFLGLDSLSADGRYVLFGSTATGLVSGQVDTADTPDVFLFDRDTGGTVLVSRTRDSAVTSAGGFGSAISADGSRVLFHSASTEVVPDQVDTNGTYDAFLYDRATGTVTLVSRTAAGAAHTADGDSRGVFLSADGSAVSFSSTATDLVAGQTGPGTSPPGNCFLYDDAGTVTLVNHAPGSSTTAVDDGDVCRVSGDGNHVLLASPAALAASPPDLNGAADVFVFDRATGANTAVSVRPPAPSATANGESYPLGLSADGRWLALLSQGTNLLAGVTDANGHLNDLFLYDRVTGTRRLVSHRFDAPATTSDGDSAYYFTIDADGRYLAFSSDATDLVSGFTPIYFDWDDLYLYDRVTGTTTLVTHTSSSPTQSAGGRVESPSLSADGRFLVWAHSYTVFRIVPDLTGPENGSQVVLYDRVAGTTTLVSHAAGSASTPANSYSHSSRLSADGAWVAFLSRATNLVAGEVDTNTAPSVEGLDLFLYDRLTGATTLVSRSAASPTTTANDGAWFYSLSQDGRFVAYQSMATDVVPGQVDTNGASDVFLFDRVTGTNTLVSHANGSATTTGNGTSFLLGFDLSSLSADGRYLVFTSYAPDLVPGTDTNGGSDAFLYDRVTGTTTRVSDGTGTPGVAANGTSFGFLSPDGSRILLNSNATNLMPGQVDGSAPAGHAQDLFLRDRATGTTVLLSGVHGSPMVTATGNSTGGRLSRDGSTVAFFSEATDLAAGDLNDAVDTFLYTTTPPGSYFTLPPCRLIDTRRPQNGPALASGATETWTLQGFCGIPSTARSVAVNITVTQPTAAGHLTLWSGDGPAPVASTLNFGAGQTRANNAILPLSATGNGSLAIQPFLSGGGTVHVLVDVVGWFE